MDALVAEHRARPFSGVIHWREPYVAIATRLAERLDVPKVIPDALLARDKFRMKEALRAHVRCAQSALVRTAHDLAEAPRDLFPGVLKPRYGFASICAVRVEDVRAARRELTEKRDKLLTTHLERVDLGIPSDSEFVLESFVGGTEHTVESFVSNGDVALQIVSDKLPMAPPHFVETGDVMPSELDEESQSTLREAARRSSAALGIRFGWTHAEIKLRNGEAWVMEVGARMGGGYTRELVRAVYGFDMLDVLLDAYAGGRAPVLGPARGIVVGRRFVVSGLSVVWGGRGSADDALDGRVTFLPRESKSTRRGLFLGAPYSYDGTVSAWMLHARDSAELAELSARFGAEFAPKQIEIPTPRSLYRMYLAAKRALDGHRAR